MTGLRISWRVIPIGNIGICAKKVCRYSYCFVKAHLNLNAAEHSRKAEDRGPIAGEKRPKRGREKVDAEEEADIESKLVFFVFQFSLNQFLASMLRLLTINHLFRK